MCIRDRKNLKLHPNDSSHPLSPDDTISQARYLHPEDFLLCALIGIIDKELRIGLPARFTKKSGRAWRSNQKWSVLRALIESQFFAKRKMVELRSSHFWLLSRGLFVNLAGSPGRGRVLSRHRYTAITRFAARSRIPPAMQHDLTGRASARDSAARMIVAPGHDNKYDRQVTQAPRPDRFWHGAPSG